MSRTDKLFSSVRRSYTIAFTARSGSSAICDILSRNGLGSPTESFQTLPQRSDSSGFTAADQVLSIIENRTHHGIFGSKMAFDHCACVDHVLRGMVRNYKTIDDLLPNHRWIWLVRRDKIAQAVSLTRAEKSGSWGLHHDATSVTQELMFDFHHILSRLMIVCVNDVAWQEYFRNHDINPCTVYYEDFFGNLPSSLRDLIYCLGGRPFGEDSMDVDTATSLVLQRDQLNTAWADRFRDYLSRIGAVDMAAELGVTHTRWEQFFFGCGWRSD